MPGIVGMYSMAPAEAGPGALELMLETLRHESFYEAGTAPGPAPGLALGWMGLDGPAAAGMFATRGPVSVLLHGELFGDDSADATAGGAAQVLRRYEHEGLACLPKLNGWFSGVIVDARTRQTILFNDRYGHGRLYCHRRPDGFYFASEAKALLARFPELRALDPQGLAEWVSCGCVLQNRTLFPGIFLLPPASAWVIAEDGTLLERTWFQPPEWETLPRLTAEAYARELETRLPAVLGRYLQGDRPLAMSLTGGLDGRMLMAWAQLSPGQLPCYTFNGPYRECADARLARRVAAACGQSHRILPMDAGFFDAFPALAAKSVYVSDGTMDVTGAAELYMNRQAREIAPVRLTGNYGSEILREHVAFRPAKQALPGFNGDLTALLPGAGKTYAAEAEGSRLSFIAFKQVPWHHYARSSVERSQLGVRSPFLDNDLVSLAFQAPPEARADVSLLLRLVSRGSPALGQIPTDRGLTYPGDSLSNRLKRTYHEFMAKAEYAYDYGMPQKLARLDHALASLHLEKCFLGYQKFCHFRVWYRDALFKTVQEVLLDPRTLNRSLFDRPVLEKIVKEHGQGTHNHTSALHKCLSLEWLNRGLLEARGPVAPIFAAPMTGAHSPGILPVPVG